MIREVQLSTTTPDEDGVAEPPSGVLKLLAGGDAVRLEWTPTDEAGGESGRCSFRVSTRSLLLALHAVADDNRPDDVGGSARRPPNSNQPWTDDLDAQLGGTWLAVWPTEPAHKVIRSLADALGRSRGDIRSRLPRVGCDPDVPSRLLNDRDPSSS